MKKAMIVAVLSAGALLAACTSTPASAPGTTAPLTPGGTAYTLPPLPTAAASSHAPVTTSATTVTLDPDAIGGSSTGRTPTPPAGTPAATTGKTAPVPTGPWPKDLTAAQVKDAQAALKAYRDYWDLVDRSSANPTSDWTREINRNISVPASDEILSALATFEEYGLHNSGPTRASATVTAVKPALVTLHACVDQSKADTVDEHGQSVRAANAPGTYWKFASMVTVAKLQHGQWQVTRTVDNRGKQC